MSGSRKGLILLFAKCPAEDIGVKTRLIPALGAAGATAFAQAALFDCLAAYRSVGRLVWCFAPASSEPRCRSILRQEHLDDHVELWPQPDGVDLGERLRAALERAKAEPDVATVSFVGSDCFEIDGKLIEESIDTARKGSANIVPAADGGYVLLSLPVDTDPAAFDNINWSCETTGEEQTRQLRATGKDVVVHASVLHDVDVPEDLALLDEQSTRARLARTHPRVWAWLQSRD